MLTNRPVAHGLGPLEKCKKVDVLTFLIFSHNFRPFLVDLPHFNPIFAVTRTLQPISFRNDTIVLLHFLVAFQF